MRRPPKRLDAFLARAGLGSRQVVKRLIRSGRVQIDGEICRKPGTLLEDRPVTCDDQPVELLAIEHIMLHKPVGYACSHSLAESPIIDELLPLAWGHLGLEPAGRLDRDTSGLLLLSSDGGFIHRLTSPRRKLKKRYRVHFSGELVADAEAQFAAGIALAGDEKPTRPALLVREDDGRAILTMVEGRNRQVRRMFAHLGVDVEALHRDRIGDLLLPSDLAPGEARPLGTADLERL